MEIISGTQTLREEFEPWLVSTGQICAELSRDYKTWPFASSEQCLVGAFLSGAARLRIPACLESNFKHVRIKDSEATYDHKYRVDLWIQLRLSSYIEFKLSVDGRDNVNLRTKVGDAKTQLLRSNLRD